MAESFLFSMAESLIEKIASGAYEEASKVTGVYQDLQQLKQTLSYIKAVLLDADNKQEHNHELREWLRQIKRLFSHAENVLDEVHCETLRKQVLTAYGTTKTKVGHFFSASNPLVFRYKMARQVKDIRKRLDGVAADRDKFCLERIDVDRRTVHRRELTYSHVVESNVIGRKHDKEKIIQLLMQQNPNCDDKSISVIPIVGIGGLGKTTLAKFVFNDERITEYFSLKMWVCVSDEFDIKQLIIKIINSASNFASIGAPPIGQHNLKELDMDQLANHLRNKLAGHKFLLVLDDVWNEDRVKWIELMDLIQVAAEGSKILVTTRSCAIASMMGTLPSHILRGLSLDDSMSLFVKWAFKEGEEEKYPNLVMIGREIVEKCRGVPLAVRTVASLLYSKLETDKWESVKNNEIWKLPQKKDDILPALKLSYDQMPSYLKQCFAMFSLYPKDHHFDSFMVASLWGALGLLSSPSQNETLEDVANQYLYELMSRSFLQDFIDWGTSYSFTMHDLVHDLALYVARDECLLINSCIQNIPEHIEHLSFVEHNMLHKSVTPKSASVKTIMFPLQGMGVDDDVLLNTWVSMYKYLRILHLSDSTLETLPKSIGKLKHLRYLNLRHNKKMKRLPDSICKLQNLQVFLLDGCTELETLPKGIRELISLRDFEITTKQSVLFESEIANLSSLQNLGISFCDNIESLFTGIKLPNLKTLILKSCWSMKFLPLDFNHFPQLETLIVDSCYKLELLEGHDLGFQDSSIRLKLIQLVSLPQLVTLPYWLQASANTLQSMIISNCAQLEVLPEWLSTMKFLKSLWINDCPRLASLPNCFTTLEFLGIKGCLELCGKCQPQVGEYWSRISHIKNVLIGLPEDR